ncbi:hypothetical protein [Silvibacterium sp.]|uniref:hypothetical protein n=1 Tax=Silvibacterium sp. TaxID=1964179 RepID=UPI0039E2E49B
MMSPVCLGQAQMFPVGSLSAKSDLDAFKNQWYSGSLHALQEGPIYPLAKDHDAECYRFLWLRSFNHPVSVRLFRNEKKQWMLALKIGGGAGGYPPGALLENDTWPMKEADVKAFLAQVEAKGFWTTPNPISDQGGLDGSQWIIEGVKNGRYHIVDRWSPKSGVARELGWEMVFDLAGLEVPKRDIY